MDKINSIIEKNDLMRKTFMFCKVVTTQGVASLNGELQSELIEAVQKFNTFTEDNDPHKEHDMGKVVLSDGSEFFWKFDYYDADYQFFEEDGHRVLTIMRTDEY